MLARLDSRSRAAAQGWSDIAIRNLFIIPTIAFLIVFNVFPLIYSLGYSFTDFRASVSEPARFVGLQNYRELLADPNVWRNFTVTAKYVIVSVAGQVVVGFGLAMLLNRSFPLKGFVTTLLLLPMMMTHPYPPPCPDLLLLLLPMLHWHNPSDNWTTTAKILIHIRAVRLETFRAQDVYAEG